MYQDTEMSGVISFAYLGLIRWVTGSMNGDLYPFHTSKTSSGQAWTIGTDSALVAHDEMSVNVAASGAA